MDASNQYHFFFIPPVFFFCLSAYIQKELSVRHGRMLASLNRHHRLHRHESAAAALGLPAWQLLWDEVPVDANGIPFMGAALCRVRDLPAGSTLALGFQGTAHSSMFLVHQVRGCFLSLLSLFCLFSLSMIHLFFL